MKLAQALTIRKDALVRMNQLSSRLNDNAKVQAGQAPSENPYELLKQLDRCHADYVSIVNRINLTNTMTVGDGQRLGEMVVQRDSMIKLLARKRKFVSEASALVSRYSKSEILIESTVNVNALQTEIDQMAKKVRVLDDKIQELNWTTELL